MYILQISAMRKSFLRRLVVNTICASKTSICVFVLLESSLIAPLYPDKSDEVDIRCRSSRISSGTILASVTLPERPRRLSSSGVQISETPRLASATDQPRSPSMPAPPLRDPASEKKRTGV